MAGQIKKRCNDIWYVLWPLGIYYMVSFVLIAAVELVRQQFFLSGGMEQWWSVNGSLLLTLLIAVLIGPVAWWLYDGDRARRQHSIAIGYQKAEWWHPVLMGIAACFCLNILLNWFIVPRLAPGQGEGTGFAAQSSILLQFLTIVIAGPLMEELLFRGVIFGRLRDSFSFWASVVFSALLFGLWHGNITQFCYTVPLGCFLAYLQERYRSVSAPILMHGAANLLSVSILGDGSMGWLLAHPSYCMVLLAASAGLLFYSIWMIEQKNKLDAGPLDWSAFLRK